MENSELFTLIKQGDRKAFEILFKEQYAALVYFASGIVKDKDTAEDLVQEVFVKIWDRKNSIEIKSSLKAYLYMAVKNHCFNKLKTEQRNAFMDDSLADDARFSENNTENASDTINLERHIQEAIDKLPPRCGLVFKLSRFHNKSYKEIAELLDISVKTVENQMGKALQMMRSNLSHYLGLLLFFLFEKLF